MKVTKTDGRIQLGATYILYGKMEGMKRFKPVSGPYFVCNLIHAEMITPTTIDDSIKMKKELAYMKSQGEFEYRKVN